MKTHDAEELWRRFGAGDGSAFTQIYSDHHHDVVRYCRSLLRDDEDAQDAAQGTWAAIWDKPDAARRDIPLRPWLFRVAHNEAISIIRRRRSHDTLADLELPATVAAAVAAARHDLSVLDRRDDLRDAAAWLAALAGLLLLVAGGASLAGRRTSNRPTHPAVDATKAPLIQQKVSLT